MGSEDYNDLRKYARQSGSASVFLSIAGKMISGQLKDASVRSVCILAKARLPVGAMVDLVILHASRTTIIKGYVERVSDDEIVVCAGRSSIAQLNSLFASLLKVG